MQLTPLIILHSAPSLLILSLHPFGRLHLPRTMEPESAVSTPPPMHDTAFAGRACGGGGRTAPLGDAVSSNRLDDSQVSHENQSRSVDSVILELEEQQAWLQDEFDAQLRTATELATGG